MVKFNDETIEKIFGAEDAENEDDQRFKEYFFFNRTYENLKSNLPIRILVGHKGIGKSAMLKRAYLENVENSDLAVWIRPNELIPHIGQVGDIDFNKQIENWKAGLLDAVARKSLELINHGGVDTESLNNTVRKGASTVFELIRNIAQGMNKAAADGVTSRIVGNFLKQDEIYIYIDDIDRGWSASPENIRNISALLNAIRDMAGDDKRFKFRIGLRTDVYFLVRTSDESTDKIERHVIWVTWSNHEILAVIAKRIETYFESDISQQQILKMNQTDITKNILSRVITPIFDGKGHWSNRPIHNVLLSLTRKRPRDLVKLLHGAARKAYANDHVLISSGDLEGTFEQYSGERLQDIVNEFKSELPNLEALVFGMRPTTMERRTSDSFLFKTDVLVKKIKNIMGQNRFLFTSKRSVNTSSLIQFLYKIDFITARKDFPGRVERKYFEQNRFLANEFVDFGFDWEVHPAYRWALQPVDVMEVMSSITPESDN